MFRKPSALLFAMVTGLSAETRLGLKAGLPLTTYFDTGRTAGPEGASDYSAATRRYTVGIAAEWQSPRGWGLELDTLYKRMGYVGIVTAPSGGVATTTALDLKGNSWDIPILAKYRFGTPFLAAGAVLRYIGPVRARGERITAAAREPIETTHPPELARRLYYGVSAAAGFEFERRLSIEFRYTRWVTNIEGFHGLLRLTPNQAELLLGLLF